MPESFLEWISEKFNCEAPENLEDYKEVLEKNGYSHEADTDDLISEYEDYCEENSFMSELPDYLDD